MIPILEMERVRYETQKKRILDIPAFELYEDDFLGIMGPNGAGKSTFLKVLAFLEQPTSGSITYRGESLTAKTIPLPIRRKFAVALQKSFLLQDTVFNNVALGLKLRKDTKIEITLKVNNILELFEISHLASKSTQQLSGGEAQRVNLARAFVMEPEVLFLDEPFSALDFSTKMKLIEDFKRIGRMTNTTTVLISHDLLEIQSLTNRLMIVIDGSIQQIGPTHDVIAHSSSKTAEFLAPWKKHMLIQNY
jgi:tungstate transport system ATP-binding protein